MYVALAWILPVVPGCSQAPATTASTDSPDGRFRVEVRELDRPLDRNFEVVLIDRHAAPALSRVIFASPDEGAPPGTERFLWSPDSQAVLLVGEHFFTDDDTDHEGERLYLLYDVAADSMWCNSSQVRDADRIDAALLARYGLTDWRRPG
jgi:hypothetical protein